MDVALYLKALILGVVEGLTEFLPISSTGHLIIASELLGFHDARGKVFEIVIQTGAMLAVIWEYRERFARVIAGLFSDPAARRFMLNLVIAFLPAAVLGLAFNGAIKKYLFHAVPVALAFIFGGLIILWVERGTRRTAVESVDEMTWKDALKVGVAQAFALIPGTSRAGATIIGGMLFGLSRRAATEFSFFLAVPTLIAAGAYDLYANRALLSAGDFGVFSVGSIAAFVSAFLCVRWLLRYIATHDFSVFAWYRIGFGLLVLSTGYTGLVNWSAG
ncbi:MAG: undecaprenyl-diphosphate phosphatase [Betaproteobacteria bacterium]|nr:undecaprenyl-diphosphate phosphatase [Betaproteobacteria bacterium]